MNNAQTPYDQYKPFNTKTKHKINGKTEKQEKKIDEKEKWLRRE